MIGPCPAASPAAGFISSITNYVDCQSQVLGSGAWQAMAAPGSTLSIVLTGLLTIFIALIGYNLLLGRTMTVRSATLAFVKIGAVFALATSWPAYRTLVYDLVTDGPSQLVAEVGPRAGVIGSDGTLVQRLDFADQALAQLAVLGVGSGPPDARLAPPPFGGFDAFALGGSRILFELTAIGGLAIVRIITGLMLALGPFFIAFLMFDNTRSLFEGWARVLAGTGLAGIGVSIALGLELALLEPWLGDVLARRISGEWLPTIGSELFVITCLFSLVVTAAFTACLRLTQAFRLAPLLSMWPSVREHHKLLSARPAGETVSVRGVVSSEHSRAAAIASVLATAGHRERLEVGSATSSGSQPFTRAPSVPRSNEEARALVPLGRSFSRRARPQVSRAATKRDAGA